MSPGKLNQQVKLADGRKLGFAEYGAEGGRALFYCHGWPSSRLEPRLLDPVCREMGIRLIAPDRPGYGLSDFKANRRLLDWPEDLCQLADSLGVKRFAVLGMSGGGPSALACAAAIPHRLTAAILICSVGPSDQPESLDGMVAINRWLLMFARRMPWLAERLAGACMWAVWRSGNQAIPPAIERRLPPLDKRALENNHLRETLTASTVEALRQGVRAAVTDGMLFAGPWGFSLEQVKFPIHLWHGESDVIVPPVMGRCLARLLPNCHARFLPEHGHFSLPYTLTREILGVVPS